MDEIGVAMDLKGVSKRYPGTLAVDQIDLTVYVAEVHALVGENGAGKSTLMKIIAGSFSDYTGQVCVNQLPVQLHTPAQARAMGIAMIHQELSLAGPLSVAENILAGHLPTRYGLLDRRRLDTSARHWLAQVGLDVDPWTPVEELSQHEAQLVEIAKALSTRPCILVMDEPTSALSRVEVDRLFELIRQLRRRGLAILYISHHLPEIFQIADRVTVLRDARKVGTYEIGQVTAASLVEKMIGGAASDLYAQRNVAPGEVKLRVQDLTRKGFFHHCSFELRAGEIVGLGGLSGAGRSELARSLCGIDPRDAGRIWLDGREIAPGSYSQAINDGLAYLTEDRKREGLALRLTMAENLLSAIIPRFCRMGFFRGSSRGRDVQRQYISALQIHPPQSEREVAALSGGNQQKVLLAKWLATDPQVLILDEPTRGVDVGAKAIIHRAIAAAADRGKSVLLVSSDLPELVGLSDRILIMRQGGLIGQLSGETCTEESVLLAANGQLQEAAS
ncbi:MAG: sugar ABC transporter ATP-binding protein [Tepidisphaeraceae bacterium]|jgi:ribose transport system ATP-binding protein